MGLIEGVVRSAERMVHVTWLEMASRRGTFKEIRREHEVLGNFTRTLVSGGSSAPELRRANLAQVRQRFEACARGTDRALYAPLREAGLLEDTLEGLRETRSKIDQRLKELEGVAPDDERFAALAETLRDEISAFCVREQEVVLPAAVEHLSEKDLQAVGERYRARVPGELEAKSA